MTNVAVIGLGNMGGAVAARLTSKYSTTGFDPFVGARERAAEQGVTTAENMIAAIEDADIVITSLPNPAIATDVWLGADGIIANAKSGATFIELSTIDPLTMTRIADAASAADFPAVVDSPVSGGPNEVAVGKLVLLVGGEDEHVESVSELLNHIGSIKRTGAVGTGKTVKLVNNMMSMINVAAAAEAFAAGVAAGVDPQRLFEVLSESGGTSHQFAKRWGNVLNEDFDARFSLEMGEKDLTLGIEFARQQHLPAPIASSTRNIFQTAISDGYAGKDIIALYELYRRWSKPQES